MSLNSNELRRNRPITRHPITTFILPSSETLDTALSKKEYPSGQAPPLDIIIYALNNILYPTFLPELMSEFLHLFTMLEFYRRRIIEKAALTIEMNTFYRSASDANVVLLDDEDELFLRNLVDEQKDVRRIFIKVVEQCCIVVSRKCYGNMCSELTHSS